MKRKLPILKGMVRCLSATAIAFIALNAGAATSNGLSGISESVDYGAITYEWTDAKGNTHVSNLAEKADSYPQIVALLKEVYTNPAVPGFVKDPIGYGADFTTDRNENVKVKYAPCTDAPYNMPADMKVTVPVEGATALLVELKDNYVENRNLSAEEYLKEIKAVSVLTKSMYIGEKDGSLNPGHLFNYVGTLNKFFIITKGCNRVPKNNAEGFGPFFMMYEEFSPSNTGAMYNVFSDMNAGKQFSVDHNCSTIMGQDHIMVMGEEGSSKTDFPVNFLFYLPDYRFAGDSRTNGGSNQEWYTYYSPDHKPFVFFSKITAAINEIPVADAASGKALIKLEWKSTYKEVSKSQVPEEFYIYRVVNDVIQPHPLAISEFDIDTAAHPADMYVEPTTGAIVSTGADCSIFVKEDMRSISYDVRYIVLGRRLGSDFELTESNVVTACVPAADGPGNLEIRIDGFGVSQYDAENERNNYRNSVSLLDHNVAGARKLLRRHVMLNNGDNAHPVFILNRVNVKNGEISGRPVVVAHMQVISEEEKYDVVDGDHYLYTARITYSGNGDISGLPVKATFKSMKSQTDVADADMPVEALANNGDMLAMFTDRFSESTSLGEQAEAYGYYVEYTPDAASPAAARMDRTLSNMVEVTVPVRELKVGIMPYTFDEISADLDAENPLPATPAAIWIETRSNPNVSQYVVTDVTDHSEVAKLTRMATGRLVASRMNAEGNWEECGSIENGYNAHPVIELAKPVAAGEELSLSLVYNNGNTYGNRRVVMPEMPSVRIDDAGIFKQGFVDPATFRYFSSLSWSAVNALPEGSADPDNDHVIAGYRSWHTHGDTDEHTLVWGLDGDAGEIPTDAGTEGLTYTWFNAHVASGGNPVSVEQKVRMYSLVPASMRIPREGARTEACYAVSDASKTIMTEQSENLPTGVENVEMPDGNTEYRYYDLTGREISPSAISKGVYIRVGGGKSEKIIF